MCVKLIVYKEYSCTSAVLWRYFSWNTFCFPQLNMALHYISITLILSHKIKSTKTDQFLRYPLEDSVHFPPSTTLYFKVYLRVTLHLWQYICNTIRGCKQDTCTVHSHRSRFLVTSFGWIIHRRLSHSDSIRSWRSKWSKLVIMF
jgi:hypothetical protein